MSLILTKPALFVGHLASLIISFWRSHDFPKITLNKQVHVFSLFTFYRKCFWKSPSEKEINKKTFIYSDYLLKNICQEDPNTHFLLKPPKTSSVKSKQTEHVHLRFRVIFGKSCDLRTWLPEKQDGRRSRRDLSQMRHLLW